jgi:hypothetical protein
MAKKRKQKKKRTAIMSEANRLILSRRFLYKVNQKICQLGVIGEEHLRMVVFLAGVTRQLPDKASVLVKGSTSSGKSTIVKEVLQLFPTKCVIERAGLSKTALAYGRGDLGDKILLMTEYRSAKDAQFLLRMMQSEGHIEHEATTVKGSRRKTKTVRRTGTPVVLSTTTSAHVHPDDETRFLSIYMTETPEQTLAILKAQAGKKKTVDQKDLEMWRAATLLLRPQRNDFEEPPAWLHYVAEHLPLDKVRVRRDWKRFLAFLRAVALCRPRPSGRQPLNISSADYCVACKIFEPVLVTSVRKTSVADIPQEELQVGDAVAKLHKDTGHAVTIRELAKHLDLKAKRIYKLIQRAMHNRLIVYEPGTNKKM